MGSLHLDIVPPLALVSGHLTSAPAPSRVTSKGPSMHLQPISSGYHNSMGVCVLCKNTKRGLPFVLHSIVNMFFNLFFNSGLVPQLRMVVRKSLAMMMLTGASAHSKKHVCTVAFATIPACYAVCCRDLADVYTTRKDQRPLLLQ